MLTYSSKNLVDFISLNRIIAIFCALLLIVCSAKAQKVAIKRGPELNMAEVRTAYSHELKVVKDAYRMAFDELELVGITETDSSIMASAKPGELAAVEAVFSPSDTLQTEVRIRFDYVVRGGDFTHYPYELKYKASKNLNWETHSSFSHVQASYPEGITECSAGKFPGTDGLEPPVLKGGVSKLTSRLRYTDEARAAGIEGRVYIEAVVDVKGRIKCVLISSGLPLGLNEMAIHAMRKSKFTPARYKGKPIPMKLSMPVSFRLK